MPSQTVYRATLQTAQEPAVHIHKSSHNLNKMARIPPFYSSWGGEEKVGWHELNMLKLIMLLIISF